MAVTGATISRGAGRVSRRLDRLSERKFALLVSIPGLVLLAVIVLPPILTVFGLSLFRIELAKDEIVRFVGLTNYTVRMPADKEITDAIPRTLILATLTTAVTLPLALRNGARPQSRIPRLRPLLHGRADAVGDRVGGGRDLLARDLRHPLRDRQRHPGRPRDHPGADQLAPEHDPGRDHRDHRPGLARRSAAGRAPAGGPQDDPRARSTGRPGWTAPPPGSRSASSRCRRSARR